MKHYKILVVVFIIPSILFLLLSPSLLVVSASDTQNERISQIESALNIEIFHEKVEDQLIKCFDVNEDGCFAVGYRNNTIQVYDSLGVFQYGYRFNTDNTYGIALKENSIVIYLGRSHNAVEIDSAGKCIAVETVYFSEDIVESVMKRTCKQIGNVYYFLERDIGIFDGDYSRLIRVDEDGTKRVLYDVTTKGYIVGAFHYVILSIFPIVGIAAIIVKVKKEQHETNGQSDELKDSK